MWLFLILLGFAGFVLSLFGAAWRGFDGTGRATRPLLFWLLAAAVFFALWLLALPRFRAPHPF